MDLIADIPLIGGFLSSAISFVVMLGIVVFIHEYGHYIVGRWCGIHAETFSLGFGPVLKSWKDKRGTTWQVAALPLGGFVRFLGDADGSSRADEAEMAAMDEEMRARSFHGAAVWKRMLTVAAGPFANFVLSTFVFAGLVLALGQPLKEPVVGEILSVDGVEPLPLREGDIVRSVEGQEIEEFGQVYEIVHLMETPGPVVLGVERDGEMLDLSVPYLLPPLVAGADAAGLKPGDLILTAGGRDLIAFRELREVVEASGGKEIPLEILRGGQPMTLTITPKLTEQLRDDDTVEERVMIGVGGDALVYAKTERPTPWGAVWYGMGRVVEVLDMSLTGLKHIILGNLSFDNLQGPLGIAQVSGQSATQGIVSFISLIAIISTAIGMLNLFPIPVLDGGHLVMHAYEAVAGRPPAEKFMRFAMTMGLGMVLLLMVFATYNDVMRWVVG